MGKNAVETAAVTTVETGMKAAASGLGDAVWSSTSDLAKSMAADSVGSVIYGSLPVVGALITIATMPHSYKRMALGAKKIACKRHAAWVTANGKDVGVY